MEEGIENPCINCEKCNAGLRIGQAMEFHELINDEILDLDKFIEKKITKEIEIKQDKNEIITEEEKPEGEQEINTSSKQLEEKGEKEEKEDESNQKNENGNEPGDGIEEDNEEEEKEEDDNMFPTEEDLGPI